MRVTILPVLVWALTTIACSNPITGPSSIMGTPSGRSLPVASPPAPVVAQLTLSNTSVALGTVSNGPGQQFVSYRPKFRLTETSGRSRAVISKVLVTSPDGQDGEETGQTCWGSPITVEAGMTSDAFMADLGYCEPGVGSVANLPFVKVTITFVDDSGTTGSLQVDVPVSRAG